MTILPSNVTTIGLFLEFSVLRTNTAFGVAELVVLVVVVVVIEVVVAVMVVIGAVEVETSADVVVFNLNSSQGHPAGQFA